MNVFLIAAISADGFIAPLNQREDSSTAWTSKEDTAFFQEKTKEAGVVIMGRKTWETIPEKHRPLKDRVNIILTSQAQKVPGSIKLPLSPSLAKRGQISSPLLKPVLSRVEAGRSGGVLQNNTPYTSSLNAGQLIATLKGQGYPSIAIIGGSSIYTQFLEAGVVDTLYLTVEPIFFGQGIPLFDKPLHQKVHLMQQIRLSDQVTVLEYKVLKSEA